MKQWGYCRCDGSRAAAYIKTNSPSHRAITKGLQNVLDLGGLCEATGTIRLNWLLAKCACVHRRIVVHALPEKEAAIGSMAAVPLDFNVTTIGLFQCSA